MSITKKIDWCGYTKAIINRINDAGEPVCDLSNDDGSLKDKDISFPLDNLPFELTQAEIDELRNPKEIEELRSKDEQVQD